MSTLMRRLPTGYAAISLSLQPAMSAPGSMPQNSLNLKHR